MKETGIFNSCFTSRLSKISSTLSWVEDIANQYKIQECCLSMFPDNTANLIDFREIVILFQNRYFTNCGLHWFYLYPLRLLHNSHWQNITKMWMYCEQNWILIVITEPGRWVVFKYWNVEVSHCVTICRWLKACYSGVNKWRPPDIHTVTNWNFFQSWAHVT